MNKISQTKLIILTLGIVIILLPIIFNVFNCLKVNSDKCLVHNDIISFNKKSLKHSKISGPVNIDDNDPGSNWFVARDTGICTGNGTYSDPYIIEDLVIDGEGSGSCILIENSNVYFRIENCTIFNSGYGYADAGIKLVSVSNGTLSKNNVNNNNNHGIRFDHSNDNKILDNSVNNNVDDGIYLYYSDNNDILWNNVSYNYIHGIYFDESHINHISGNTVNNNGGDGISSPWYVNSNFNIVSGNTVSNNGGDGIELSFSSYTSVAGNTVENNGNFGITLNGYDNLISGNTANSNMYGIRLDRCYDSEIFRNTANNNIHIGIWVSEGSNNKVSENFVLINGDCGISVSADYHTISGNTVINNNIGIILENCDTNTIIGNTVSYNDLYGIYVENSKNIDININIFHNNAIAIYLYKSKADTSNNTFNDNDVNIRKDTESLFPFEIVIIIIIIITAIIIVGILVLRKKASRTRTKVFPFEKYRETFQSNKKPSIKIGLKTEIISELKSQPEIENLEIKQEKESVLNINQLRSKYKVEIEEIRDYVLKQNKFLTLNAIDEILIILESLKLRDKQEVQTIFLNKLLSITFIICENDNRNLINSSDIEKANQELHLEENLMRRISETPLIEERFDQEIGSTQVKKPEEVEVLKKEIETVPEESQIDEKVLQEEVEIPILEEQPEQLGIVQEEIEIRSLDEQPEQLGVVQEEVEIYTIEEELEEVLPPEPQITSCPFCGLEKSEEMTFCPQCGMIFKK